MGDAPLGFSVSCPLCSQLLQRVSAGDRQIYRCFVCEWSKPVLRYDDDRRWWGAWHLPLVDLFIRPTQAFRQWRDHPVFWPALLFCLGSSSLLASRWPRAIQRSSTVFRGPAGHMARLVLQRPWALSLAFTASSLLSAALFYAVARGMRGQKSSVDFGSYPAIAGALLVIHAAGFIFLTSSSLAGLHAAVALWAVVWTIWAMRVIFSSSVGEAVLIWLIALVLKAVIVVAILAATVLGAFGTRFAALHPRT